MTDKPPAREVRIPLNVAIAATITIVGAMSGLAGGLFTWHAAQRELLEGRLTLALQDAVYTIGQRDDRQDARRAQLYDLESDPHERQRCCSLGLPNRLPLKYPPDPDFEHRRWSCSAQLP